MVHKMPKNKLSYTFRDIYKSYNEENPNKLTYSQFKAICDEMCKLILETLQDRSEGVKMPCGLGYLQIGKYKPKEYSSKSLSIDYKASKEYDKKIYHLNEHSNGYKFRLYWSKVPFTFADRYKYQLSFVRANKRRLAQLIFKHKDYININDIQVYKM